MYICDCGRSFNTPQGLGKHKKFCGNYKIFIDNGYKCKIGNDGNIVYIHREVMEDKLGRKLKPGELVHHKDENKLNNDSDNLELSTSIKHGKHHFSGIDQTNNNYAIGSKSSMAKLNEKQVVEIKKLIQDERSDKSISQLFNVHCDTIRYIRTGRTWKHVKI